MKLSICVAVVFCIFLVGSIGISQAVVIHVDEKKPNGSSRMDWGLLFVTSREECSDRNYDALEFYYQIAYQSIEQYNYDHALVAVDCVSIDEYPAVIQTVQNEVDLPIIVLDMFLSHTQRHTSNSLGHYSNAYSVKNIVTQAKTLSIENKDTAWTLSHEIAHSSLDWMGYNYAAMSEGVHIIQREINDCKTQDTTLSRCQPLWTVAKTPSGSYYPIMKANAVLSIADEMSPKPESIIASEYASIIDKFNDSLRRFNVLRQEYINNDVDPNHQHSLNVMPELQNEFLIIQDRQRELDIEIKKIPLILQLAQDQILSLDVEQKEKGLETMLSLERGMVKGLQDQRELEDDIHSLIGKNVLLKEAKRIQEENTVLQKQVSEQEALLEKQNLEEDFREKEMEMNLKFKERAYSEKDHSKNQIEELSKGLDISKNSLSGIYFQNPLAQKNIEKAWEKHWYATSTLEGMEENWENGMMMLGKEDYIEASKSFNSVYIMSELIENDLVWISAAIYDAEKLEKKHLFEKETQNESSDEFCFLFWCW